MVALCYHCGVADAPILDVRNATLGSGIPTRLIAGPDGVEVRTLRPPRRGMQRLTYGQIAQVAVVRGIFFATLIIETRGGGSLRVAGMTKAAAEEARALIWSRVAA